MLRALPPPVDYPVLLSDDAFENWLCSAKPGSWCAYRVFKRTDEMFYNWATHRVRMGKALYAHATGCVVLVQRWAAPGVLHYLARIVSKKLDKNRTVDRG